MNVARSEATRELVMANRILAHQGVLDAFGHVTIRDPEDPSYYLMSRSRAPRLVDVDDILRFTLDGAPVDHRGQPLYAERPIHGEIYKARPDVHAICHNHAHSLLPYGVTPVPLRPVFHMAAVIGTQVPVWDVHEHFGDTDLLVTDSAKGASLAHALGEGQAVLMRGHGGAVVGADVRQAVFRAYYLMVNAKVLAQALAVGGREPAFLSPAEVALANRTLSQALSQNRAWEDWASQAGFEGLGSLAASTSC